MIKAELRCPWRAGSIYGTCSSALVPSPRRSARRGGSAQRHEDAKLQRYLGVGGGGGGGDMPAFCRPAAFDHAVVFKVSACFTVKTEAKKPHETWSIGAFPLTLEFSKMEIVRKCQYVAKKRIFTVA